MGRPISGEEFQKISASGISRQQRGVRVNERPQARDRHVPGDTENLGTILEVETRSAGGIGQETVRPRPRRPGYANLHARCVSLGRLGYLVASLGLFVI